MPKKAKSSKKSKKVIKTSKKKQKKVVEQHNEEIDHEAMEAQADLMADIMVNTDFIREEAGKPEVTKAQFNALCEHIVELQNMAFVYELLINDRVALDIDSKNNISLVELPDEFHQAMCPHCNDGDEMSEAQEEVKTLDKKQLN